MAAKITDFCKKLACLVSLFLRLKFKNPTNITNDNENIEKYVSLNSVARLHIILIFLQHSDL